MAHSLPSLIWEGAIPIGARNFISTEWSPELAYAIGLIASDGCLSRDGRDMSFVSKDIELILAFKQCLGLSNPIGLAARGSEPKRRYFLIQFGSRTFYDFLLSIGLMPAKSKILGALQIPACYFADFFRGCIDGDGHININRDPESQHLELRLRLSSASQTSLRGSGRKWQKSGALGAAGFVRMPRPLRFTTGRLTR